MKTKNLRLCFLCLLAALVCFDATIAAGRSRAKSPASTHYIYRYTLRDKQQSTYSLDHPSRWLSHKAIERRRRQGLQLDSTDLPVSTTYLRAIERELATAVSEGRRTGVEAAVVGTSRWNNTVLVASNDTALLRRIGTLGFVCEACRVWTSPDSVRRRVVVRKVRYEWNSWDSVKNERYGNGKEQIEMVNGHRLHNIGLRGKGMSIAVLDGGFEGCDQIPAIVRSNVVGVKDFVYPNSSHFYHETDHGTKVLSAMAANEPSVLVGTAPEARYWLLRCEDQQSEQPVEEDYWAMAAEFADSAGVDVINSSLGYSEYDGHWGDHLRRQLDGRTALISRTASLLARKGMVLVNSAGNLGMGPWKKIVFPADAHEILTVGALNQERQNAPFCGVGPTQDGRVKPDVMALGSPATLISGQGTIVRDMGTSFSTPVVSGLVACLWSAMPRKTALEIINLVRQSSSSYQEPDNVCGYGLPNFWRAYMIGRLE